MPASFLSAHLSSASLDLAKLGIENHSLPVNFIDTVTQYYWPLCQAIKSNLEPKRCNIIGIQGSQGSGKSTCAEFVKTLLESEFELKVLVASIDDFYLSLGERQHLAKSVHPLLLTRGVPGTHDTQLIEQCFIDANTSKAFSVPSFSKAIDDRAPTNDWPEYQGPFDVVILEGWCVGVIPQDENELSIPINDLERLEDQDQVWRNFVNAALSSNYQDLFRQFDLLISLQAPSFDCVYDWRSLQEQKLTKALEENGGDASGLMNSDQLKRFISHYQRLTEHAIKTLPELADINVYLNKHHQFTRMSGVLV